MTGSEPCACDLDIPIHATRGYRRALWVVGVLNLLMGIAETSFGFPASSQALKADALDFIRDGLIPVLVSSPQTGAHAGGQIQHLPRACFLQ